MSQIEYLLSLERGSSTDRSRVKDINIGVLAAREIEPLSMETAEILHAVAGEARHM